MSKTCSPPINLRTRVVLCSRVQGSNARPSQCDREGPSGWYSTIADVLGASRLIHKRRMDRGDVVAFASSTTISTAARIQGDLIGSMDVIGVLS